MTNENKELVQAAAPSNSQRFVSAVMREFTKDTGLVTLTSHQKNLIQGYFIACDQALNAAESKRLKDAAGKEPWATKAREKIPYVWNNVNVDGKLAQRIVVYAKLGLDMTLANHLFAIPYMNGKNGKYDLNFQEGYKGREIKTKKYSFYDIMNMQYELVYSNDEFIPHKKDTQHPYDTYEFKIKNPFDRGILVGGFAYVEFNVPNRNFLLIMSKADIEKRHKIAKSKEFWDNWYDEMALKTVVNAACNKVTLDPEKIDPDFRIMQQSESDTAEAELAEEISANANREPINVTPPLAAIPQQMQPSAAISQHTQQSRQTVPAEMQAPVEEAVPIMGATVPPDEEIEF